jgi:hypothetical protein
MRWPGHVPNPEKGEICKKFRKENFTERDHLEHLGINGRIILKGALRKVGFKVCSLDS